MVSTIPTIGFNVETLTYKNLKLQVCSHLPYSIAPLPINLTNCLLEQVWDLGGQSSIRPY